jgi:O-antigen/teichoic acid export membrane protein
MIPTTPAARAFLTTTVAYGVLEAGSRLLQALAIFLLAYWFSKPRFSDFYTYLSLYQLVTVFGTGGLLESLMNRVSRAPDAASRDAAIALHVRTYVRRAAAISLLFFLAMLAWTMNQETQLDVPVLCAALVTGALNGLVVLIASNFTYAGQNGKSIVLRSVYSLLSYSLALLLAYATGDILMYFWGQLLATAAVIGVLAWRLPGLRSSPAREQMPVGSDGSGWFLVPAILNWFFWYGLVVCVSTAYGAAQAADLAFANNVAQGLNIINLAVSQAWVARYLQHFADSRKTAESRTVFVFRLQSVVMLLAAIGAVVAYELFKAWNLPLIVKYGDIGLQLAVLLFAISASSNYFSAINSFAVNGEGRALARISMLAYLASIIMLVMFAVAFGVIGVYFGLALLVMTRGFATAWYAIRRLRAGFFDWRLVIANVTAFGVIAVYYLR